MNALKSINARVKVLQKKHPKSKRTTLQKQAGREWKSGKLKNRKPAAKKKTVRRKAVKRKPVKRRKPASAAVRKFRRAHVARVPTKRRAHRAKRKVTRYRRVSGTNGSSMSSLLPIAAVVIGGLLIYKLMSPATLPPFTQTTNPYRVQAQNSILQWAQTAGLGIAAITQLINAINSKSDNEVTAAAGGDTQGYLQSWGITAV